MVGFLLIPKIPHSKVVHFTIHNSRSHQLSYKKQAIETGNSVTGMLFFTEKAYEKPNKFNKNGKAILKKDKKGKASKCQNKFFFNLKKNSLLR